MKIICHFDGSCEPINPGGRMGIGVSINIDGKKHDYSESFSAAETNSNNVAEYSALSYILYYLEKENITEADVIIIGDSQMVIQQMAGKWKIKNGMYAESARQCREKLVELTDKYPDLKISFKWVNRDENYYADNLSKK